MFSVESMILNQDQMKYTINYWNIYVCSMLPNKNVVAEAFCT